VKVVGLDLSLTSTGVAVATPDGAITDRITTKPVPNATLTDRAERIARIVVAVLQHVTFADLVVIEGPSYGSTTPHQHDRAGLWWQVVGRLWQRDYPLVEVPPSTRMRYATGRGNAGKDDVLSAVIRRYPHIDVNGNDEADSLILAAMGIRHLGAPLEASLPATHLAAMTAVKWPEALSCVS
jgi:crossover junction endodeoxyribonuclease RuvC